MKHLDPLSMLDAVDGAALEPGAVAHLRACEACRRELEALQGLGPVLAAAPAAPRGLSRATLERLGIATAPRRWAAAWLPAAVASMAALVFILDRGPEKPVQAPSAPAGVLAGREAPAPAPAVKPAPAAPAEQASRLAAELLRDAGQAAPAALGQAPAQAPTGSLDVRSQSPKEAPTPTALTLQLRDNLIRPGRGAAMSMTLSLPDAARLSVRVFDDRGRAVATLYDGPAGPGQEALQWDGGEAPSGVYTLLIVHGSQHLKKNLIIAR